MIEERLSGNQVIEETRGQASWLDFGALFGLYYPKLYRYARYRVDSLQEAEDLTALVFERALTHQASYDPAKGAFSTWLFRIAHNAIINHCMQHRRRGIPVDLEEIADLPIESRSPEEAVIHKEGLQRLLQRVSTLSPRDQDILALKFASRLTNREIAETLDLNEKTVSVILLRSLRKLRQQIEKDDADEGQLASALSTHIDAMLAGQSMPLKDGPEELRQLLHLAGQLATIDLPPRPAFDQQLKRSLLKRDHGGSSGSARSSGMLSLMILGLVALVGIFGIGTSIAILAVTWLLPQRNVLPTSTPHMPSLTTTLTPIITPVPPTLMPTVEATAAKVGTIQPPRALTTDRPIPRATPSPIFPSDRSDDNDDHHCHNDHGHGDP